MTIRSERVAEARPAQARPKHRLAYLPTTALLLDVIAIVASCLVAVVGRGRLEFFNGSDVTSNVVRVAPVLVLVWIATIAALGGYRTDAFGAGTDEFKQIFSASVYAAGLIGIGCYLTRYDLSRGFFVLAFTIGAPALLAARFTLRRAVHRARAHGSLLQCVTIAGGPAHVDEIAAVLSRESWLGYRVVGALLPSSFELAETRSGIPVVGRCDIRADVIEAGQDSDILFFTSGSTTSPHDLREIAWDLEDASVQLVVAPSVTDISSERVQIRPVGGLPLVHLDPPRWAKATSGAKRLFDLIGTTALILLGAPLIAYAALRVKLHDGGPILFKQTRVGRNGEEFGCFKFRTMVVDAEALLAQLHAEQGFDGGLFKMENDPRITRPGRWLRRFSIDELPQLFNVWRGEMSLVGPRPQLPSETEIMQVAGHRRHRVRPGMTGLWQVSGRSNLTWDEAIRLDIYYVDNWSLLQDLNILAKTFGAVIRSHGAY